MRIRLAWWVALLSLMVLAEPRALAATYQLNNGQTVEGEPIAPNPGGVIFKSDATSFSDRISWTNFTEQALREMAKDPEVQPFVQPYLFDETVFEEEQERLRKIDPKTGPKLDRPDLEAGYGALFSSTLSLVLLGLVYLANIYAGFEIGIFRNYNPYMVAGISAVVPFLGPAIFLCLPTNIRHSEEEDIDELAAQEQALAEAALAEAEAAEGQGQGESEPSEEPEKPSGPPEPTVYARGRFTFNRRFFETKFANFLRVAPTEEDKDLVFCVESMRGNYVAKRIAKVEQNELVLLVTKDNASTEVSIPFGEIKEVQVRHKDA